MPQTSTTVALLLAITASGFLIPQSASAQNATSEAAAENSVDVFQRLVDEKRETFPDDELKGIAEELTGAACATNEAINAIYYEDPEVFDSAISDALGGYKQAADDLEALLIGYEPRRFYTNPAIRLRESQGLPRMATDKDALKFLESLARDSERIAESIQNGTAQRGDLERLIENSGDVLRILTLLIGG